MDMSGLPDIRNHPKHEGHRPEGVHIRQTMSAHVTTVMYHQVTGAHNHNLPYLLGYKYNFELVCS